MKVLWLRFSDLQRLLSIYISVLNGMPTRGWKCSLTLLGALRVCPVSRSIGTVVWSKQLVGSKQ